MDCPLDSTAVPVSLCEPRAVAASRNRERDRGRRVILLALAMIVLGLGDLYLTLTHATGIGMHEVNPVAAYLIAQSSVAGLILYKLGCMGVSTGLLFKTREHRIAEPAAWFLALIMVCLTLHWWNYNRELTQDLNGINYVTAAQILHADALAANP